MGEDNEDLEIQKQLFMILKVILKDGNLATEFVRRYGYAISVKNLKEFRAIKSGGATPTTTSAITAAAAVPGGAAAVLAKRAADIAAANKAKAEAAKAAMAQKIAEKQKLRAAAAVPLTDQDPVFSSTVNCPICGHTGIVSYELRAKSQQVVQTVFLVPIYSGATGYLTADYTRLAVTVCPMCLLASPDKKNFNYPSFTGNREEPSSLQASVILSLKDKIEEHKLLLPDALGNADYFKRERSAQVAIQSYRLAMARAAIEAELQQPYSYFKMGSYALKIAYIMKSEGQDDTGPLTEALGLFETCFQKSECPSDELEMQVVYLNVVLPIRLGDFSKANSYLNTFGKLKTDRLEAMKKNPSLNTKWIEKWEDKARYMWEERDNPKYFGK
jgi:DNA-directed RNA polymerase subunit M/transcription elongation factor TFIIS